MKRKTYSTKFKRHCKKLFVAVGVMGVLATFQQPITAHARPFTYSFTFRPPFQGSANNTSFQLVGSGTASPYVAPNAAATPTTYVLQNRGNTVTTNWLTNISTAGRRNFTFGANQGGQGTSHRLVGYPSNHNFHQYSIGGMWSPW